MLGVELESDSMLDTIKQFKVNIAILVFMGVFYLAYKSNSTLFFNSDGSLKQFGVGYKHKTVVPLWLFAILSGIVVYIVVSLVLL